MRQRALPLLAARIGDQCERDATRLELAGQRFGREHVPAGAAGRQDDRPLEGTRLGHHTASRKPACSRVSDSIMPTQIAMASAEEPP